MFVCVGQEGRGVIVMSCYYKIKNIFDEYDKAAKIGSRKFDYLLFPSVLALDYIH